MDAYQAGVIAQTAFASGVSGMTPPSPIPTWFIVWMRAPLLYEFTWVQSQAVPGLGSVGAARKRARNRGRDYGSGAST
jgi:hypothetical protein